MIPGELGWFGINPADGEYDGLQYDEVEYLMCKSLAHDSPISLQTSFLRMEQHPSTKTSSHSSNDTKHCAISSMVVLDDARRIVRKRNLNV